MVESSRSIGIGQWVTKIVADASNNAGVTQLVESQPSKLLVAGSSPVSRSMKYFVYILESKSRDRFYIGSTENLDRRVEFHNSPQARWTKRFQPWVLRYFEEFETRSEAVIRENELKRQKSIKRYLVSQNL